VLWIERDYDRFFLVVSYIWAVNRQVNKDKTADPNIFNLYKETVKMKNNYPKKYCNFLSVANKEVVLGETVILCIKGVASLGRTFYLLYDIQDAEALDTYPVLVSTSSGNVPLVDSNLVPVTYGDLVFNSVYNIAKVNVCGTMDCCSNQQVTYFQVIGLYKEAAATSNSTTVTGGTDSSFL
jgi:hypothetical protein